MYSAPVCITGILGALFNARAASLCSRVSRRMSVYIYTYRYVTRRRARKRRFAKLDLGKISSSYVVTQFSNGISLSFLETAARFSVRNFLKLKPAKVRRSTPKIYAAAAAAPHSGFPSEIFLRLARFNARYSSHDSGISAYPSSSLPATWSSSSSSSLFPRFVFSSFLRRMTDERPARPEISALLLFRVLSIAGGKLVARFERKNVSRLATSRRKKFLLRDILRMLAISSGNTFSHNITRVKVAPRNFTASIRAYLLCYTPVYTLHF